MSFPNLSALAVRERAVTLFFILLSVAAGLYSFLSLGRAEDPAFTVRVMVVSAVWPGASAEQLQSQVVDRLEKRIQEVEYLNKIETTIRPGRADLQVEFHDHTPSQKVPDLFYQVRKRMQDEAARLPRGVIGPVVNDDFGDVYFSLMALTAPGLPLNELTREAEAIRDRLQRLPGLHKALLIGERPERVFLDFDMARLNNLGLSPQAVFDAIDASNQLLPAGSLELEGPRAYLRVMADLSDPERLAALPLRVGSRLIRLSDIASVRRGHEDPPSYLVRSRGQDALLHLLAARLLRAPHPGPHHRGHPAIRHAHGLEPFSHAPSSHRRPGAFQEPLRPARSAAPRPRPSSDRAARPRSSRCVPPRPPPGAVRSAHRCWTPAPPDR